MGGEYIQGYIRQLREVMMTRKKEMEYNHTRSYRHGGKLA